MHTPKPGSLRIGPPDFVYSRPGSVNVVRSQSERPPLGVGEQQLSKNVPSSELLQTRCNCRMRVPSCTHSFPSERCTVSFPHLTTEGWDRGQWAVGNANAETLPIVCEREGPRFPSCNLQQGLQKQARSQHFDSYYVALGHGGGVNATSKS